MTKFEEPILKIVKFSTPDVITTSGNVGFNEALDEFTVSGDAWTGAGAQDKVEIFFTL